jgi:H+-transporting ATPase
VVKGAPTAIAVLTDIPQSAQAELEALSQQGFRVLAIASGPPSKLTFDGLIGLSDPPRSDSKTLLNELRMMGVRTIMVTGDTASTAAAVAHEIELDGAIAPAGAIPERVAPEDYSIYAGVFPEDKFRLVKAFQRGGHTVAMCGDGANDAPALRQAQLGIAVSTATDVAKSAASIVLTEPGLAGIVDAVKEGRSAFQRILTYTLNALVKKIEIVLFLGAGLIMTGHPVLTPMFMALLLVTGDFITMALTTDRAIPTAQPDRWRMQNITAAAIILGLFKLMFSVTALAVGKYLLHLTAAELQTLSFIAIVFGGQATVYVFRERKQMWRSRPSNLLVMSSILDTGIASTLAIGGLAMAPLSAFVVLSVLFATTAFAFLLDPVKIALFSRLHVA